MEGEGLSLSDLIRARLAYGGLTYSMEVDEPLMREVPVSDVVISVLQAVDEWLNGGEPITLEGEGEEPDLTIHHLAW